MFTRYLTVVSFSITMVKHGATFNQPSGKSVRFYLQYLGNFFLRYFHSRQRRHDPALRRQCLEHDEQRHSISTSERRGDFFLRCFRGGQRRHDSALRRQSLEHHGQRDHRLAKGIWGSSPSDIFAVGSYSANGSPDTILHYDGQTSSK